MDETLSWLQHWFASQCDGDWEHDEGIRISTLDNPGWEVKINLEGTELEGYPFPELTRTIDDNDWVVCRLRNAFFEGFGGPSNLTSILEVFRAWQSSIKS